jgi:hypothetical protein
MAFQYIPEFPPILPPGRHLMSLVGLQSYCLDPFPSPTAREQICAAIELLIGDLAQWEVRCEVWFVGDFLTTQTNPECAVIAIVIGQDAFDLLDLSLRNDILTNMDQRGYDPNLDLVVIVAKSRDDPDREVTASFLADWMMLWQTAQSAESVRHVGLDGDCRISAARRLGFTSQCDVCPAITRSY